MKMFEKFKNWIKKLFSWKNESINYPYCSDYHQVQKLMFYQLVKFLKNQKKIRKQKHRLKNKKDHIKRNLKCNL